MNAYHDGYLRQTALKCHSSILTVDSCTSWRWNGDEDKIDEVLFFRTNLTVLNAIKDYD